MAIALTFAFSGVAYANFGPHGGYSFDTDACAGCHRAHTSFSTYEWTDQADNKHSALLVSNASTIKQFCYACHGDGAPGAATNVQSGIFDSGPSGSDGVSPGNAGRTTNDSTRAVSPSDGGAVRVVYETNSMFDAALNGGGFDRMPDPYNNQGTNSANYSKTGASSSSFLQAPGLTFKPATSAHDMDLGTATDPMWGAGQAVPAKTNLTCTGCHDPHGSSNYRILKDLVNGNAVGGYVNDVPQPFVTSAEEGYPADGWLKHDAGASQMTTYYPNFTNAEYAYAPPDARGQRSMSTWCAACHERYDEKNSNYDYRGYIANDTVARTTASGTLTSGTVAASPYSGGAIAHRRHPVNTTLVAGRGAGRKLVAEVVTSAWLPLEARPGWEGTGRDRGAYDYQDYMGCLTCHRAHGTSVDMTGWAEARIIEGTNAHVKWYPQLISQGPPVPVSGVNPNFTSALLRADNRGVCERCHNK